MPKTAPAFLRRLLARLDRRAARVAEDTVRARTAEAVDDLRLANARGLDDVYDALADVRAELAETRAELAVLRARLGSPDG